MAELVPSTRLVTKNDDGRNIDISPVATKTQIITVLDTVATKTENININGRLLTIISSAPAIPTDSTYDIAILDDDNNIISNTTGITEDSIVRTDLTGSMIICAGAGIKAKITFSTALSGDTAVFDLKFEYSSEF